MAVACQDRFHCTAVYTKPLSLSEITYTVALNNVVCKWTLIRNAAYNIGCYVKCADLLG